jgi:nucleoid-associated protein YgaU
VQTKTTKNRGLMGLTALAMLAVLVGLGWTAFTQKETAKTPTKTETATDKAPQSSADAVGTTDTTTVNATPGEIPESHIVADGETLSSIAQRYYGDANYYWAIERANNLVGTRDKLMAGTVLTLPTMDEVASNN